MGGARLLRRRLGAHPVAVAAVLVSVLAALTVVTGLQLLSAAVTDSGVRSALDAPAADRSVVASAALRPGGLAGADTAVREALSGLPDATVTRVGTATTRGLPGRAATDRAQLADVDGIEAAADLTAGRWPALPTEAAATGDGRVEVVLPEAAAQALAVGPGDTLPLSDIVDDDAPDVTVEVVGLFRPRAAGDALWADLPLGLTGVTESDFTTYGPFVVAPGTFDGPLVGASTVTWRAAVDLGRATAGSLPTTSGAVDTSVRDLRAVLGLPVVVGVPESAEPTDLPVSAPRVSTDLPRLLDAAALVGDRIRVSLLTPTVLLVLLGVVALVGATALLASLREGETRLLRVRGASTTRLAALALGDAVVVAGLGAAGAAVLGPVTARLLTEADGPVWRPADLADPDLWRVAAPLAVLAVAVTVGTTLWVGRGGPDGRAGSRGRGAGLRLAAGSGLDLVLVALAAVAAVQLRRYDAAGSTTVDPLTAAAPALVVAGLAVLSLRLLPRLARVAARWGERRPGLDAAWGGWQFARRVSTQTGTLLLVLLAAGMGTIALGHSATVGRAVADQSAFETGAPLRVDRGFGAGADRTGPLVADAVGGDDGVMPVWRGEVDLGGLDGITVLAVDAAAAGRVMDPRPDTVEGGPWSDVVGRLVTSRDLGAGLAIPEGTRDLVVRARLTSAAGGRFDPEAGLRVRDGRGVVHAVAVGRLTTETRPLTADLERAALVPPLTLVGLAAPLPDFARFVGDGSGPALEVTAVEADGRPLDGTDAFTDDSTVDAVWWDAEPAADDRLRAVVTREVARAIEDTGAPRVTVPLGPRDVAVEVAGVVDVLPTAADPARGVLLDLPSLAAAPVTVGGGSSERSRAVLEPSEWWAAPEDPTAAAAAVTREAPYGTAVVDRDAVVAERLADPVNRGMRAAMLLVTLASVLLAGVGFAASTAALGRTRRHENAVLMALGTPPARIRGVLLLERVLVVATTVLVGLVLGVVAAILVVPLLVGGDGHAQVPPVRVALPPGPLAGYAALLLVALAAVGALVLRSASRDLAGELREGEPR